MIVLVLLMGLSCGAQNTNETVENQQNDLFTSKTENTELIHWIERKVDSVIRENNIPAISVGIVKNGDVLFSKGFGIHNRNAELPVSENSIFQIASDTKKMTGIIANNLVRERKLKLAEPIINYIGDQLTSEAKKRLQNITVKHLLVHTSGLPYREPTTKRKDGEPMLIPYTEKDLLNDLNNVELSSVPGTEFKYSNFGYALAGYICEKASGKEYSELLFTYISKAYEMPNTTILLSEEQKAQLVTPYLKTDRNRETKPFIMGKLSSAGGVYSTVADLTILMINQINAYAESDENNKIDNPLILNENLSNGVDGYGFGLGKKVFKTGTQYGHGGDLDGFASVYIFSPEYKVGVILLTSSGGTWVGELEKELFYKLTNRNYMPPKKSIAQEVYHLIMNTGFENGKKWFNENLDSDKYYLNEAEMNNVGYAFLQQNSNEIALSVFKFNVELFPNSANVYDSLGEVYLKIGNVKQAIKNYEKSVLLNPKNENAIQTLKKLKN